MMASHNALESAMNLGSILGQILQQGMSNQGRSRLDHAVGSGGIGDLLGGLLGGQGGGGAAGGIGDLLGAALGGGRSGANAGGGAGALGDLLGGALGGGSLGGGMDSRPAAAGGGLNDLLGGILGGGQTGRARAGGTTGMAILATIAMAALKNWTDNRREQASPAGFAPQELEAMTAPDTEALIVRAMASAAKADGQIEEGEIQRIVGKLGADGLSEEEKQFLIAELRAPLDLEALVADVPNEIVAAEVYAASLLAIDLDTREEVAYLRQLAQALRLDGATVARLHQITGATPV